MSALLTDLYQLTMWQAYLDAGMDELATFELFVRKLPAQPNFLVAAGLEQALQFLDGMQFSAREVALVQAQESFSSRLLEQLRSFRFTGDVTATAVKFRPSWLLPAPARSRGSALTGEHMKHHRTARRVVAVGLMCAGGMVMLLSASARIGLVTLALGIVLELVGLALERRYRS